MEKKNYFAKSCFVAALTNVRLLRLAAIHEAATADWKTPPPRLRQRPRKNGPTSKSERLLAPSFTVKHKIPIRGHKMDARLPKKLHKYIVLY